MHANDVDLGKELVGNVDCDEMSEFVLVGIFRTPTVTTGIDIPTTKSSNYCV
jgi:hypothetical protein